MVTTTAPLWTGWLEADLGVATVDVSLRSDSVSFGIGSRTIAVVDRDQLREWVSEPFTTLAVDDVVFLLVDRQLSVLIDGAGPYPLPAAVVAQLVRAL